MFCGSTSSEFVARMYLIFLGWSDQNVKQLMGYCTRECTGEDLVKENVDWCMLNLFESQVAS